MSLLISLYFPKRVVIRFLICLFAISGLTNIARGQKTEGIQFFKGTWKQLLVAAQAQNKPIFVDVYTDWCAPCKRMEQEIFVLPEVGEYYNNNFICYRFNAENGEGPALSKKFGITAYPTWLYLSNSGSLQNRRTDYMPAPDFIEAGKAALGQDSVSGQLSAFDQRFRIGERSIGFLREYIKMRTALQLDNADVLNAYLKTFKGKPLNVDELRFLINNSGRTWSAAIPVIADNLQMFDMPERRQMAGQFFENTLYFVWGTAATEGNRPIAAQALAASERLYPLLDTNRQLTADHAAVYHCHKLKLTEGLKRAGYRLAAKQMAIDTSFARNKDKELFQQVMAPFISGKQDSTKIAGFAEEKRLASTQYSGKVATLLYEVANAFAEILPPGDPALHDAALWAKRAEQLLPNQHTKALNARLSGK
ncbi:thioredoxin family protein [Mucilaginibacter litoreus]